MKVALLLVPLIALLQPGVLPSNNLHAHSRPTGSMCA
jgi:hypothetical protein